MDNNLAQNNNPPPAMVNTGELNHKNSRIKMVLLAIFILILIAGIAVGTYLIQQKQIFKSKAAEKIIAQVNSEKITATEFDKTKKFFANLSNKSESDPGIDQQALKYAVEHKLLKKYATQEGLLDQASQIADKRFDNIVKDTAADQPTTTLASQDKDTYKEYILDQVIREQLQQSAIQWKKVHFLSIRYNFDDNDIGKQESYKETVGQKIKEYQAMITDEASLKEAIKKRCQDPEINYLPYESKNKVYTASFNGTICREQAVNLKISISTNPMFGNNWLKKVFENTKKGEVSQIIDYTDKNLGMYFIVYEIDEGGENLSLNELINKLKTSSSIQIYQN